MTTMGPTLEVWMHDGGNADPKAVSEDTFGVFDSSLAYVIQHSENETTRVFVWSDADVSETCLKSAVEHAQTLCASIEGNTEPLHVKKEQEMDDFRKLFSEIKYESLTPTAGENMAMNEEVVPSSIEEATTIPSGAATTSKKKKKKKKKGGAGNAAQNPHAQEGSSAGNEEAATVEKIVEPCDSSNDISNDVEVDEMAPSTAVQEITEEIQEQKDLMEDPQDLNPAEETPAASEERKLQSNQIINEEERSEPKKEAIAGDNVNNVSRGGITEDSTALSNKKSTKDDREDAVGESFQTNPVRNDAPKVGVSGRSSEEVSRTQNEVDEEKETIEKKCKDVEEEAKIEGPPSVPPTSSAPVNYLADSAKAWSPVPVTPQKNKGVPIPAGTKIFTYEELKALRPESGVDMTCKESYLSDEEFEKVFKKDRATWNAQPAWRRLMQKKDVGLW